jgi:hypothetical protein
MGGDETMNVDSVAMPHAAHDTTDRGATNVRGPLGDGGEEPFQSFAEGLLRPRAAVRWADEGRRLAIGLGLAALFGGAIGLRVGGGAIVAHAVGVPLGLLSVAAVAVPAFAIVLALANAPIDASVLGRATARAAAKAGLVLGGLAPATALYVVTVEDAITVSIVGFGGLFLAGVIALRSFAAELGAPLRTAPPVTQMAMTVALPAFLLFACALAVRVWWLVLPILTGVR